MSASPTRPAEIDPVLLAELTRAVASIRFGTVELTIHEGRVVQIERREKIRLTEPAPGKNSTKS